MYQSCHRLWLVVVSVVPSLAASCCVTGSIARSQLSYHLLQRSWSIVLSVVPSRADRVGCSEAHSQSPCQLNHRSRRCISRSIARGQMTYQSIHRLLSVALSVVQLLAVGRCISRSIARGQFCISRSIARSRVLYHSRHSLRSGVVSVDPSLAVGRCISRSIACGRELYLPFHLYQS